jgi:hypothetical protein
MHTRGTTYEVSNQEDHQGDVELVVGHASLRLHIIVNGGVEDLGIANVGAVEVA